MEQLGTIEVVIAFDTLEEARAIFGNLDRNIKQIEAGTGAQIIAVDSGAQITGSLASVQMAKQVLENLQKLYQDNDYIDENRISYLLDLASEGESAGGIEALSGIVAITHKGKPVKARTLGQKRYVEAIDKNTVVFSIGPAGTGKTYLAMAKAVVALKNKVISRIILTRPAVEAGEKLGFLPGDLQSKVDPYLRPLYDALYEFMGPDAYQKLIENGTIEVAPLAYMRGRTLTDSFIILDEAQNCSMEQLKMFLTRFGEGSKVVVTGDITQIDLPEERKSGLKRVADILRGVEQIEVIQLTNRDVVRHKLVKDIVKAFEKVENQKKK
ncbi:MAG: PhoH family protein [Christensenellaceae bacterium]